jgi:hypothetical protein
MPDEQRRAQVVSAIASGRLPARPPKKSWGGMGSGEACSLCGTPIDVEQVGTEFKDQGRSYHLHLQCMTVWEAVTTLDGPSSELALQPAVDGDYSLAGEPFHTGPKR